MNEPVDALERQDSELPETGAWSVLLEASGSYVWDVREARGLAGLEATGRFDAGDGGTSDEAVGETAPSAEGTPFPLGFPFPFSFEREELRLDVDGRYPQLTASGTACRGLGTRVDWIARLRKVASDTWTGSVWHVRGDVALFPYKQVEIKAVCSVHPEARWAKVSFSGGDMPVKVGVYKYRSRYFRDLEFEFDRVTDAEAVTSVRTDAHPNHPSRLPSEALSIEEVFSRSGFDVRTSGGQKALASAGPAAGEAWSDAEVHDAMQTYWSRFAERPESALWLLFARLHEQGSSLGGVTFDGIGRNERRGSAIFSHSFIACAPAGEPHPEEWVARMRFWIAVHAAGHGLEGAYAWQKGKLSSADVPWLPLTQAGNERSFMSNPYGVVGGEHAFFREFEYRFGDPELLFMRHLCSARGESGSAEWFDDHGFQQATTTQDVPFRLHIGFSKRTASFEFLEPVVLETVLRNYGSQPEAVDANVLAGQRLTVIIKHRGRRARQWIPFARYYFERRGITLQSGEELSDSIFISAGRNGWDIAEPGSYSVQVAVRLGEATLVSNVLDFRVERPKRFEDEQLAQDVFSEHVGRVLAFDGSLAEEMRRAHEALHELVDKMPASKAATHARVARAIPRIRPCRRISIDSEGRLGIGTMPALPQAVADLKAVLCSGRAVAAETLGYIDYRYYLERLNDSLRSLGDVVPISASVSRLAASHKKRQRASGAVSSRGS